MKKTFFLALLFCLAFTYQLQAQGFSYSGFKGGLSVARMPISFETIKVADTLGFLKVDSDTLKSSGKFQTGAQFGVFAGKEFTKTIGVRLELNYVEMGRVDTINFNQHNRYKLHYFSFDPMLQIRIAPKSNNHFYIVAGPSARLLIGTQTSTAEGIQALNTQRIQTVRQTDLGVNFGFSYLVGLTPYLYLTLEARAYYGLKNIAKKPKENSVTASEYVSARNAILTAQLAVPEGEISEETLKVITDSENGTNVNNNTKVTNQGAMFSIGFCVPLRPPADKLIKMKKQ